MMKLKNKIVSFAVIMCGCITILLTGCASTMVTDGLTAMQGKHIQVAFDVLGYPDSKVEMGEEMGEETVYLWIHSSQGFLYSNSSTVPYTQYAKIKIVADKDGYIKTWSWEGNEDGLDFYADSLNEYAKEQEKEQ